MKSAKKIHEKFLRYICENLDQQVDSRECREVRKHLADCPECMEYLSSLRATVDLYRRYTPPPLPAAAKARLRKELGMA